MGGQEGNRGYLIQTIVCLLDSLGDSAWDSVTLEPDASSQKVDILWTNQAFRKAVQVKSSINQISKADAESWASELKSSASADSFELILVGPCAQSVVEMGLYDGVSVPCPKSPDIQGLLDQAAHLLDKFLLAEGLGNRSAHQRELIVDAMVTRLSVYSTKGTALTRSSLIAVLGKWVNSISNGWSSAWERVQFAPQRGLEHAIAGQRLGPLDVDVCPTYSICDEIIHELDRSHAYAVVGIPGCGKSITAWQVAKHFHDQGFSVWRPAALTDPNEIIATLPSSTRQLLVVDDAQRFGKAFADRLMESASQHSMRLLVSTVTDPLVASVICVHPERCVDELVTSIASRRDEVAAIVRKYDPRIGDRSHETAFEDRIYYAQREKTPWGFFFVLRGGWQAARREFAALQQFPNVADLLTLIAAGQVLSCDAGVSREWLLNHAAAVQISAANVEKALTHLTTLGLVIGDDEIRTKHLQYAFSVLEETFRAKERDDLTRAASILLQAIAGNKRSFRGISWLLDAIAWNDGFRWHARERMRPLAEDLIERCTSEIHDVESAAACLSRLFAVFNVPIEAVLKHRRLLLEWASSSSGRLAYSCSKIISGLITDSNRTEEPRFKDAAKAFNDDLDAKKLANIANRLNLEDFFTFGSLLERVAFYGPRWSNEFIGQLNWSRLRGIVLDAAPDYAQAVNILVYGVSRLADSDTPNSGLRYVEDIVPFIVRAINARPDVALGDMHEIVWYSLRYPPRGFRHEPPTDEQARVAKAIVGKLVPKALADAMITSRPRDLENLAKSFEAIHDIDFRFLAAVADSLDEASFFTATAAEWRAQSGELQQVLPFFFFGPEGNPARSWIRANKSLINSPLKPMFACLAPDVALEFYKTGREVDLVDLKRVRWDVTSFAIKGMMGLDKTACVSLIESQVTQLECALYALVLDPQSGIARFFRALHELSPVLYEQFVERLDLDKPEAKETINQLLTSQPKERLAYIKLARAGRHVQGTLGTLSSQLLERLGASDSATRADVRE